MLSIPHFLGLDTKYPVVSGDWIERVYLDSTASTLALAETRDSVNRFMAHYSNTHSEIHNASRISTDVLGWCHSTILSYFETDENNYTAIFSGAGSTAAINKFACKMAGHSFNSPVLISLMEHHSNDLPHRINARRVKHIKLRNYADGAGEVDTVALESELRAELPAYIALTAVSNVTGIINPITTIAKLANKYKVPLLVDFANGAAHWPLCLENNEYWIDAIAFSSHKIYAPSGPGVLIVRNELLEMLTPTEVGGGAVTSVTLDHYVYDEDFFHRENAGTPNLPGIVALSVALYRLKEVGLKNIHEHETKLTKYLIEGLQKIDRIRIYGSLDPQVRRISTVSFNIIGIPHSLAGAILNDYFNIAIRNQCFCAHPYVKHLMFQDFLELEATSDHEISTDEIDQYRGMLRASIGIYSSIKDIDHLLGALQRICNNSEYYTTSYVYDEEFRHKTFRLNYEIEKILGVVNPGLVLE